MDIYSPRTTCQELRTLILELRMRQREQIMGNHLRLRFWQQGDSTGPLAARAEGDGFAGELGAHFSIEELQEFAEAPRVFPSPPQDHRRSIASGFGSKKNSSKLEREPLGISVYLASAQRSCRGIQVEMATEVWPDSRPESRKQAVVEIITTYKPLAKLSRDLGSVLRGWLKETMLDRESLS